MLWIGITGPMGSGKSAVARELRHMGFKVLDADQLARDVIGPGTEGEAAVFKTFGEGIREQNGNLDRKALAKLVFSDTLQLAKLERLVHPFVRQEVARQKQALLQSGSRVGFYDVPLLYEKSMESHFDHVIVVTASQALRYKRLHSRSQLTEDEIVERTRHHISEREKLRLASVVVKNNGTIDDLRFNILQALNFLNVPLPAAANP